MMTAEDCLREAFAALLRGDTAERDRLCRQAEDLMRRGETVSAGGHLIKGEPIKLKGK